jgi:hypothetical protein
VATLKRFIDDCHAAGLLVCAHTLPTFVPNAARVATERGRDLRRGPNGEPVVVTGGIGYHLDLWNGGVARQCEQIAAIYREAGFDYIYADGLEEVPEPYWCSTAVAVQEVHAALVGVDRPPLWIEASAHVMNALWPYVAINGQTDWYLQKAPFRAEANRNVAYMLQDAENPTPRQLGWAPICHPNFAETTPDEVEYLLARSMAWDVPIVFVMWSYSLNAWSHRDASLHLIYLYEKLRLQGHFPAALRLAARKVDQDYMLFPDGERYHWLDCEALPMTSAVQLAEKHNGVAVSAALRGYVSRSPHDGAWHATLWAQPVTADGKTIRSSQLTAQENPQPVHLDGVRVRLPKVASANVSVSDIWSAKVTTVDAAGDTLVPLASRIYLKLPATLDAKALLRGATVER